MRNMSQRVQTTSRDAVLVEDAALLRMMGMPVLEAVPSAKVPYGLTDPFILVHEARFRLSELAGKDTRHPHRGFDNLWYVLQGEASSGHTTGPGGSIQRARLQEGSLLWLRTGRGAWHAEAIGADERNEGHDDTVFRSVLFWVNLARKDKQATPRALVLAAFGANRRRARPPQLVLLGPGGELTVTDAGPGTRFMLMAGKPYGEAPVFNGPFVD
jgi:redox-sensitive bicupin YhaK (pirin superfamily)